ncbi:hypothetical protein [Homoserinibacter gongjuensis]|uniref:hypothetical protein n=1 Tax=Homoserinibacter gongjuensis TaxID=1162968 RepID=UPI0024E13A20|nr:hypothetical protein [Homoserinibacter gongjuensis]
MAVLLLVVGDHEHPDAERISRLDEARGEVLGGGLHDHELDRELREPHRELVAPEQRMSTS